jgi:sporulation protein YlmC with PRC-barrel domain
MTTTPAPAGRAVDAALHLLDRQILDIDLLPVAKVDDVECTIREPDALPIVTALLCGPAAWGPRVGGRLGAWIVAVHRRITGRNRPVRIPFQLVKRIESSVDLTIDRDASGAVALDHWVRRHVIGRIPGAYAHTPTEPHHDDSEQQHDERASEYDEPEPDGSFRLSSLINVELRDANGRPIGEVHDVYLVQDGPPYQSFGAALRVHGLAAGSGSTWARLGLDRERVRGPWLLTTLARRAAKSTMFVPWSAVQERTHDHVVVDRNAVRSGEAREHAR